MRSADRVFFGNVRARAWQRGQYFKVGWTLPSLVQNRQHHAYGRKYMAMYCTTSSLRCVYIIGNHEGFDFEQVFESRLLLRRGNVGGVAQ